MASKRTKKRKQHSPWPERLLLLVVLVVGGGGWWTCTQFQPASRAHAPVRVTIPPRSGVSGAAEALEGSGIIRNALAFNAYARWRGEASRIKAGRYTLSGDMTLGQILRQLVEGPMGGGTRIRVTIPEGFTLKQVAAALTAAGVTNGQELLRLATDRDAIADLHADFPLPRASLEGYLFPDTYDFPPHAPPMQVIERMLANFGARFARPYQQEIAASGRSLNEIVTVASMVEREARAPQDRPRIASVIYNRLRRGMKLAVDATVIYAIGHHKSRVLNRDLEIDSPYNTYRHTGLPPGPIADPGIASLVAALQPEQSDYLYYVARPDGTHIFTRTVAEHEAAIREVRAERQQKT